MNEKIGFIIIYINNINIIVYVATNLMNKETIENSMLTEHQEINEVTQNSHHCIDA